jgi:hypothetical protein
VGDALGQPRFDGGHRRRPGAARRRLRGAAPPTRPELLARGRRRALRRRRRRRAAGGAVVDGHRLAGRLHLAGGRGVVAGPGPLGPRPRGRRHQGRRRGGLLPAGRRAAVQRPQRRGGGVGLVGPLSRLHAAGPGRGASGRGRPVHALGLDRRAAHGRDLGRRPAVGLLVRCGRSWWRR